jgi:hypothetical protein
MGGLYLFPLFAFAFRWESKASASPEKRNSASVHVLVTKVEIHFGDDRGNALVRHLYHCAQMVPRHLYNLSLYYLLHLHPVRGDQV